MNTVAASMARQGLVARSPKRKRRWLTRPDKAAAPIPDLVRRDFGAAGLDQKWCGDLTEIPTDEGKLYLATVEDLASRRLCGFALGDTTTENWPELLCVWRLPSAAGPSQGSSSTPTKAANTRGICSTRPVRPWG